MLGAIIGGLAGLAGGAIANRRNESTANKNTALQRQFAQQGIQWKVADAKAAGVHPLYAMGAQTMAYQPIAVQDSIGPAVANMGQDISRAMMATADRQERRAAIAANAEATSLGLENQRLQNEYLRAQIAKLQGGQIGPPMPGGRATAYPIASDGIVTRDLVEIKPAEVTSGRSESPYITAGPASPGGTEFDFGSAGRWVGMSPDASQSFEDMSLAKYGIMAAMNQDRLAASWRNYLDTMAQRGLMYPISGFTDDIRARAAADLRNWAESLRRYGKRRER